MAEQPNYLSDLNARRMQARGGVRRRIDATIDPMESMARTDAMQGSSVSAGLGSGAEEYDGGGGGIIRLASYNGGAGSRAIRNLSYGGGCANGQCGIPQGGMVVRSQTVVGGMPTGTVVSSAPVASTVVQSSSPVVTSSAPVAAGSRGDEYGRVALDVAGVDPSTRAAYERQQAREDFRSSESEKSAAWWAAHGETVHQNRFQEEQTRQAQPVMLDNIRASTALTQQQATEMEERSIAFRTKMLTAVRDNTAQPEDAVSAIYRQRVQELMIPYTTSGQTNVPPEVSSKLQADAMRFARRVVYGVAIVDDLADAATQSAYDPNKPFDADEATRPSLERLAGAYYRAGLFDKSSGWEVMDEALQNDVSFVLETSIPEQRAAQTEASMKAAGAKPEEIERAVAQARITGMEEARLIDTSIRETMRDWYIRSQNGTLNWNDLWDDGTAQPAQNQFPDQNQKPHPYLRRGAEAIGPVSPFDMRPVDTNDTLPAPPAMDRRQAIARTV